MPALLRPFAAPVVALVMALGLVAATFLAAAPVADASGSTRSARIMNARDVAIHHIGDAYHYGSAGPHRFDCSGLIYFSYHRVGFGGMPRTASGQAHFVRHIKRKYLRPGDLMFFYGNGGVYHVGMFLRWKRGGKALMVDAEHSGTPVKRDVPWTNSWFAGTMRRR